MTEAHRLPQPVASVAARPLGRCPLRVAPRSAGNRSGWFGFELQLLRDSVPAPLMSGIYSVGGRGVAPWFEIIEYRPRAASLDSCNGVGSEASEVSLFRRFYASLPPQGHLMLWCEAPEHEQTHRALLKGAPPAVTRLGHILFRAGFPRIKFFDLAEGGWEGEQKLWAERPGADLAAQWKRETLSEVSGFLRQRPGDPELTARARSLMEH